MHAPPGLGIWGGEFVMPRDWRRGRRMMGTRSEPQPEPGAVARERGACDIKGNISHSTGRRLYHVPGDRDYANTRISPARGERWFCSEAEAAPRAGGEPALEPTRPQAPVAESAQRLRRLSQDVAPGAPRGVRAPPVVLQQPQPVEVQFSHRSGSPREAPWCPSRR